MDDYRQVGRSQIAPAGAEHGQRPSFALGQHTAENPLPNVFDVLLASVNVMEMHITESRLRIEPPDLLIRPPLGDIRFLEFGRAEAIDIGYAALDALDGWL